MKFISKTSPKGFSLLEAIVALLLVTMLGMATFSWISNLLLSVEKIESRGFSNLVKRNVNEYLSDINMMSSPSGEQELSGLKVIWNAELVEPIKKGRDVYGGETQFELGLYRVIVSVEDADGELMEFQTLKVGYKSIPYEIFNKMRALLNQRGFTLLEMMVVLVIVSLISVLLMQGFGFVVGLQERIKNQLVNVQNIELKEHWFRLVVRSIVREQQEDFTSFEGEKNRFVGTSIQPLKQSIGIPTHIEWSIQYDGDISTLYYLESEAEPVKIIAWKDTEQAFRYLDESGDFYESWPPEALEGGSYTVATNENESYPLPVGIALVDVTAKNKYFWYVSISDNTDPLPDIPL